MTTADYAAMGRLGTRAPLLPRVPAALVLAGDDRGHHRRGLLRRKADPASDRSTHLEIVLVDYSVTGVGFLLEAGTEVPAGTDGVISLGDADTHVRVIGNHVIGDELTWGAMFLDPRPELLRAIESGALHRDVDREEARWNTFGN